MKLRLSKAQSKSEGKIKFPSN